MLYLSKSREAFMKTVAVFYGGLPLLAFRPVHCPPSCLLNLAHKKQQESRGILLSVPDLFVFYSNPPNSHQHLNHKTTATPKGFHQHFLELIWTTGVFYDARSLAGRPLLVTLSDTAAPCRTGQRHHKFWHLNNDNKKKKIDGACLDVSRSWQERLCGGAPQKKVPFHQQSVTATATQRRSRLLLLPK